jgi:hypothetical protein
MPHLVEAGPPSVVINFLAPPITGAGDGRPPVGEPEVVARALAIDDKDPARKGFQQADCGGVVEAPVEAEGQARAVQAVDQNVIRCRPPDAAPRGGAAVQRGGGGSRPAGTPAQRRGAGSLS